MSRILDIQHYSPTYSMVFTCRSQSSTGTYITFKKKGTPKSSLQVNSSEIGVDHNHKTDRFSLSHKVKKDNEKALDSLPNVKLLREFQKEELIGKVVMVRFDSNVLLGQKTDQNAKIFISALSTIKYLHEVGAKVILTSSWSVRTNPNLCSINYVSAYLSSVLELRVIPIKSLSFRGYDQPNMDDTLKSSVFLLENLYKFKEDLANNSTFSEELCSGVDIFVNDAFFESHKVLASTVGVTSFCYASVAGFQFEEGLLQLKKAFGAKKNPYIAMVGGGNLVEKAEAVHCLVSSCDSLVFVGNMAFQLMHAFGLPVPRNLVEPGAFKEATRIIQFANSRNVSILFPKDFWCMNYDLKRPELIPAHCIREGWSPFALGPNSLEEITLLLSKSKKIVWISPIKFGLSVQDSNGTSMLAKILHKLSKKNCEVTVIGNTACEALMSESTVSSVFNIIENASVVWEFLKGRKLPGLMALDKGYPFIIDWHAIYADPTLPLLVDIGSGNGMFLFGMARKTKNMNFLGLEMNGKLVKRCLDTVHQSGLKNGYFIETNATSTFRSIVSGYPGELVIASIQCPNPDFNRPENRWKMVQRSLIEAIADRLSSGGKVFLQSDIEAVASRMKQQFLKYGKGKFIIDHEQEWLTENPFGVRSDWEKHVLSRGVPMYRLLLSKTI